MKATDLMIGDWVYLCYNDEWNTKIAGKVSLLSCGNSEFNEFPHVEKKAVGRIQLEAEDGFQFWQMDEGRNFEPIPLTSEILEKNVDNVYKRCENGYSIFGIGEYPNNIEVTIYPKGGVEWTINGNEYVIADLVYVHQLQHALKLCGIEKEVVV